MRRYLKLFFVISLVCTLASCTISTPQYIIPKNKPNNNYYSSELYSHLNNSSYTLKIFDMNVYKYYEVDKDEPDIILGFLNSLNNSNFDNNNIDSSSTPRYKIIIEFIDSKYIINVFNEDTASIHPWDGVYEEDIISSKNVPLYYNLYKFCEYIEKKNKNLE